LFLNAVFLIGGWEFNRATNEVVVLRDMGGGNPKNASK